MSVSSVARPRSPRKGAVRWREICVEYERFIGTQAEFCRLHGIDPYTWLVDVLQRISTHPARDVAQLTPRLWKGHFADNPMTSDVSMAVPAKVPQEPENHRTVRGVGHPASRTSQDDRIRRFQGLSPPDTERRFASDRTPETGSRRRPGDSPDTMELPSCPSCIELHPAGVVGGGFKTPPTGGRGGLGGSGTTL